MRYDNSALINYNNSVRNRVIEICKQVKDKQRVARFKEVVELWLRDRTGDSLLGITCDAYSKKIIQLPIDEWVQWINSDMLTYKGEFGQHYKTELTQKKRYAKEIAIPVDCKDKITDALDTMKQFNPLCHNVVIENNTLKGNINGIWALAVYCAGYTSATEVSLDMVQHAKQTGTDITNLLFY